MPQNDLCNRESRVKLASPDPLVVPPFCTPGSALALGAAATAAPLRPGLLVELLLRVTAMTCDVRAPLCPSRTTPTTVPMMARAIAAMIDPMTTRFLWPGLGARAPRRAAADGSAPPYACKACSYEGVSEYRLNASSLCQASGVPIGASVRASERAIGQGAHTEGPARRRCCVTSWQRE